MYSTSEKLQVGCVEFSVVVGVLMVVVGLGVYAYYQLQTAEIQGTLTSTFVDDGNMRYVFQHEDGTTETLTNDDSILQGKWNSNDVAAQLEVGQEYTFKVNGVRVRMLSWHRNILEIK